MFPIVFDSVFGRPASRYHGKREPFFDFFDEAPMVKVRREFAKPVPKEPDFALKIDCCGYSPENLNINIEKEVLVVEGKLLAGDIHSDSGTLERSFVRRIPIPDDVDKNTLKSELKDGKLIITAERRREDPEPKKVSIPINFVTKSVTPPPTPKNEESQSSEKTEIAPEKEQSEEKKGVKILRTEDPET
ncbi:hypothetical protein FO519_004186 [Halicephalobus sp. NKZ332]|nr:hypothetical protein FO519_004186 [Halicephalobus sp. NKZ332]